MPGNTLLLVREGHDVDKALGRDHLAIDELAPHILAVERAQAVVKDAARAQIEVAGFHLEALRSPPLHQVSALGVRLPYEITRRIADARDNELLRRVRAAASSFSCGHAFSQWARDTRSSAATTAAVSSCSAAA